MTLSTKIGCCFDVPAADDEDDDNGDDDNDDRLTSYRLEFHAETS